MSQSPQLPPALQITRLMASLWVPQAIHAAAVLGLAEALAEGPRTGDAVAQAVGANPDGVGRLLRALVTLGLVEPRDDGTFALTPAGACLRVDAPDSVRDWALLMGSPFVWDGWGRLTDCVRTGRTAPELLHGVENFAWLAAHPAERDVFDRAMHQLTRMVAGAVAHVYDFAGVGTVVDVGGGYGALLPPILAAFPQLRGVVYDLPHCEAGARALFAQHGLGDRCRFEGGSFFERVPSGGDAYLLKSVIHDWDDDRSRTILRACRAAMTPAARLLLVEAIAPERPGTGPLDQMIAGTDLNMLVMAGGRERTAAAYRRLLEDAGFTLTRTLPTPGAFSVLEARPA